MIKIILNKDHLTKSGFSTILSYYASINKGVSKKVLKYSGTILNWHVIHFINFILSVMQEKNICNG